MKINDYVMICINPNWDLKNIIRTKVLTEEGNKICDAITLEQWTYNIRKLNLIKTTISGFNPESIHLQFPTVELKGVDYSIPQQFLKKITTISIF